MLNDQAILDACKPKRPKRGGSVTGKPWKKGESGNPMGRPPGTEPTQILRRMLSDIIKERLFSPSEADKTKSELDLVIRALVTSAKQGDSQSSRVLLDRGFGQPVSTTELMIGGKASDSTLAKWLEENG